MDSSIYVDWATYRPKQDGLDETREEQEDGNLSYASGIRGKRKKTKNKSSIGIELRRLLKQEAYDNLSVGKNVFEENLPMKLAYLPLEVKKYLLEKKRKNPLHHTYQLKRNIEKPYREAFGVALFIDISGFTALGASYQKIYKSTPKKAPDYLAAYIIGLLNKLSEVCYDFGGHITKFAGDAILCVWDLDLPGAVGLKSMELAEHESFFEGVQLKLNKLTNLAASAALTMKDVTAGYAQSAIGFDKDAPPLQLHGAIGVGNLVNLIVGKEKKEKIHVESLKSILKSQIDPTSSPTRSVRTHHDKIIRPSLASSKTRSRLSLWSSGKTVSRFGLKRPLKRGHGSLRSISRRRESSGIVDSRTMKMSRRIKNGSEDKSDGINPLYNSAIDVGDGPINKHALRIHLVNGFAIDYATKLLENSEPGEILSVKTDSGFRFLKLYLESFCLRAAPDTSKHEPVTIQKHVLDTYNTLFMTNNYTSISPATVVVSSPPPKRVSFNSLNGEDIEDFIPSYFTRCLTGNYIYGHEIKSNVTVGFVRLDDTLLKSQFFISPHVTPVSSTIENSSQNKKSKFSFSGQFKESFKYLDLTFTALSASVQRLGGHVRDLIFDDKGTTFIFVMVGEHSKIRAVLCANEIRAAHVKARIGISVGPAALALCGNIEPVSALEYYSSIELTNRNSVAKDMPTKNRDSLSRCDLVFMSQDVNTAARLMSNAKNGEILVSNTIKSYLGDAFEICSFHETWIKVKGKDMMAFSLDKTDEHNLPNLDNVFRHIVSPHINSNQIALKQERFLESFAEHDVPQKRFGIKSRVEFGDALLQATNAQYKVVFIHGPEGSGKTYECIRLKEELCTSPNNTVIYTRLFRFRESSPFSSIQQILLCFFKDLTFSEEELFVKISTLDISLDFLGWMNLLPFVGSFYSNNSKSARLRKMATKVHLEALEKVVSRKIHLNEKLACLKVLGGLFRHISAGTFSGDINHMYYFLVDELHFMDPHSMQLLEAGFKQNIFPENIKFVFTLRPVNELSLNRLESNSDQRLRDNIFELRSSVTKCVDEASFVDVNLLPLQHKELENFIENSILIFFENFLGLSFGEWNYSSSKILRELLRYPKPPNQFIQRIVGRYDIAGNHNLRYIAKFCNQLILDVTMGKFTCKLFDLEPSVGTLRSDSARFISRRELPGVSIWLIKIISILTMLHHRNNTASVFTLDDLAKVANTEFWIIQETNGLPNNRKFKKHIDNMFRKNYPPHFMNVFRLGVGALLDMELIVPVSSQLQQSNISNQMKPRFALMSAKPVKFKFKSDVDAKVVFSEIPQARYKEIEKCFLLFQL